MFGNLHKGHDLRNMKRTEKRQFYPKLLNMNDFMTKKIHIILIYSLVINGPGGPGSTLYPRLCFLAGGVTPSSQKTATLTAVTAPDTE